MPNYLVRKLLFILTISLLFCFRSAFAIEPLKSTPPPDLPKEATSSKKIEVLEEKKEVLPKKTNLTIERIHPQRVRLREKTEIILRVKNLGKEKVKFSITETLKPDLFYPDPIEIKKINYQGFEVSYYLFEGSLAKGEQKNFIYHIIPQSLGMILFSPATLKDEYGNNFESPPTTLEIICQPNGKCEKGENYIFCAQDCPTGSKDDTCDGVKDGRCDPDCQKEADPDCLKPRGGLSLYWIIGAIIILLIAVLIFLPKILKKKKK